MCDKRVEWNNDSRCFRSCGGHIRPRRAASRLTTGAANSPES